MKTPILAGLMVAGAALAVFDLVTGWMISSSGSWIPAVVGFGLFFASLAAMGAAVVSAFRDRGRIKRLLEDPAIKVARLAVKVRWSSVIAVGFAVLLFADCSGASGSYTAGHNGISGPMSDPTRYWLMAAGLALPTLILLALPGVFAAIAARGRAHGWAVAAIYSCGAAAIVAFVSAPFALVFGVSACDFGTSPGMCAAGVGGIANGFTIAALGLFLPYLTLLLAFLPRNKPPS